MNVLFILWKYWELEVTTRWGNEHLIETSTWLSSRNLFSTKHQRIKAETARFKVSIKETTLFVRQFAIFHLCRVSLISK